ncbi:MAG TPA: DNA methyltransferase [Gammaproteobacteria bacterium]|nr:DNA methyltransferase [Gammaproteobacteria bacterium]
MAGQKANLVFTDPPYNVDYKGGIKNRRKGKTRRNIYNDNLPIEVYTQLLQAALTNMATYSEPDASLYLCHSDQYLPLIQSALTGADYCVRAVLVWAKQHFVFNYSRYKTQHEPILYCHRIGQKDVWYGDSKQSTLWCFDRPVKSDLHPTMKPVALIQQALYNSSLPGDRVLDLFGGSGSTLMACHNNQRQAFLMEIQPNYVDVIIRRWQQQTKGEAIREQDKQSFAALESLQ